MWGTLGLCSWRFCTRHCSRRWKCALFSLLSLCGALWLNSHDSLLNTWITFSNSCVFVIWLFLVLACKYCGEEDTATWSTIVPHFFSRVVRRARHALAQGGWTRCFRVLATGDVGEDNAPSPLFSGTPCFLVFIVFVISPLLSSGCPEVLHAKLFSVVIDCERVTLSVRYSWLFVHSAQCHIAKQAHGLAHVNNGMPQHLGKIAPEAALLHRH